ncbi:MAG: hypothetical protein IPM51_11920 [Sphingobacteriaceae bacterium]|nr:hypothetical protein [Sphingobacteriaceae bacterium]
MGRKVVAGANGKTGKVRIGSTELCVTEWNATEMADEEDTTNSCSDGYNEQEYGNKRVEGSISADWDATVNPVASAPTIRAGAELTDARLFVETDGTFTGVRCHFPLINVNDIRITVPSKGKVSFSFNFKNKGAYAFLSASDYSA